MHLPSLSLTSFILLASCFQSSQAFSLLQHSSVNANVNRLSTTSKTSLFSTETTSSIESQSSPPKKQKKLTLLTFDLDDTLYPIDTILSEANSAFSRIMTRFGFDNIEPPQIRESAKAIRERMALTDPERAAALTHTEIRRLAIREEMEKAVYQKKLQSCADDWATQVSSLSPLVVQNAKT